MGHLPKRTFISQPHPCFLNSAPTWSDRRTLLRWPSVSISGVGMLGLACSAGQFITTQPCFWLEGLRYSVAPPARTALKAVARSTLTRSPSRMTSPAAMGRTPLPRRDATLDITAGGTWAHFKKKGCTQKRWITLSYHGCLWWDLVCSRTWILFQRRFILSPEGFIVACYHGCISLYTIHPDSIMAESVSGRFWRRMVEKIKTTCYTIQETVVFCWMFCCLVVVVVNLKDQNFKPQWQEFNKQVNLRHV